MSSGARSTCPCLHSDATKFIDPRVLLFAAHGPDHANAGVRIFRVIGTERRFGPEHNVEERPRIEGPLPKTLDEATKVIGGLLRRPSRLVGTKFRETPEYPEFSWKEALLNALAHRDYGVEGRAVEVWLFDDRLEVTSPGGLVPQITIADLVSRARQHVSRNPRIVRVMVDLGYMRDQGEGIPRVFAEMEGLFLPEPDLESDGREFRLVLRNTPTLTGRDRAFIALLGPEEFSDDEFRALLEAHRHGRIDNARMRAITGLDTLGASRVLRKLCDRGWLKLHPAGSQSFYEFGGLSTEPPHASRFDTHDEPAAGQQGARRSEPAQRDALDHGPTSDRGGFEPEGPPDRGGLAPGPTSDRGGFEPEGPPDRGGSMSFRPIWAKCSRVLVPVRGKSD